MRVGQAAILPLARHLLPAWPDQIFQPVDWPDLRELILPEMTYGALRVWVEAEEQHSLSARSQTQHDVPAEAVVLAWTAYMPCLPATPPAPVPGGAAPILPYVRSLQQTEELLL